jgi:sodium/hydrogen exchanger 8
MPSSMRVHGLQHAPHHPSHRTSRHRRLRARLVVWQAGFVSHALTVGHCLLFAALISPTDPVATLSVLREVRAPPMLRNMIFGEATLNDALSIVVFQTIRAHYHKMDDGNEEYANVLVDMGADLAWAIGGSIVIGCGFALMAAYLTRGVFHLRAGRNGEDVPHAELALLCTVALLTFTAAEGLGLSGIASLFFCGILTRHYTFHSARSERDSLARDLKELQSTCVACRLSAVTRTVQCVADLCAESQRAATTLFATLAMLGENALATMLGVAAFEVGVQLWLDTSNLPLALVSVPILFVARALNVFPLSAVANCLRRRSAKQRISWRMQVVMWFSAMRGALSFALVITLQDAEGSAQPVPPKVLHTLVTATLFIIVFTTLFMAPATRPLIRVLRLGAHATSGGHGKRTTGSHAHGPKRPQSLSRSSLCVDILTAPAPLSRTDSRHTDDDTHTGGLLCEWQG